MKTYILDTNFFFNMEIKSDFGSNPKEIIMAVTDYARKLKKEDKAGFYMPPRIVDEILTFVDNREDYVRDFLATVTVKAPEKSKVQLSTDIYYDLIEEIRQRSYRGLQVAEEELEQAVKSMAGVDTGSRIDFQKALGVHIKKLRDRYRNATRVKFLDSVADLDVIILAAELGGTIVTSDEGVLLWARKIGVREAVPHVLRQELDGLLQA